jgi:hypothetical protein
MGKYICTNKEKNGTFNSGNHSIPTKIKVGDIIYAEKMPFDFDYFWRSKNDEYFFHIRINNVAFNLSETYFNKYFINIAEWRDKQIDSILNDDN